MSNREISDASLFQVSSLYNLVAVLSRIAFWLMVLFFAVSGAFILYGVYNPVPADPNINTAAFTFAFLLMVAGGHFGFWWLVGIGLRFMLRRV